MNINIGSSTSENPNSFDSFISHNRAPTGWSRTEASTFGGGTFGSSNPSSFGSTSSLGSSSSLGVGSSFGTSTSSSPSFGSTTASYSEGVVPKFDLLESSNSYRFLIEIPGASKVDTFISYKPDRHQLEISAERKGFTEDFIPVGTKVSERGSGKFYRLITLPADAQAVHDVHAKFHDGVLVIDVPKTLASKSYEIKIE
jgi:HSP20 family molecular chaperone IbpA